MVVLYNAVMYRLNGKEKTVKVENIFPDCPEVAAEHQALERKRYR